MRSSAPPSHLPSCLVFLMGLLSLFALKTRAVFPALQSLAARLGFRPKRVAPSGLPHLDIVGERVSSVDTCVPSVSDVVSSSNRAGFQGYSASAGDEPRAVHSAGDQHVSDWHRR